MNAPRRKMMRILKICVTIVVIAIIILLFRSVLKRKSVSRMFESSSHAGKFEFEWKTGIYTITNNGETFLSASIPTDLLRQQPQEKCVSSMFKYTQKQFLCLEWDNIAKFEVYEALYEETVWCYNIIWTSKSESFKPMDCVKLSNGHWYGGSALKSQQWPLEEVSIEMQPYISSHISNKNMAFGSVIERYWINSQGVGIFVDNSVPLHVSFNNGDNVFCLKSDYDNNEVYPNPNKTNSVLRYLVCKAPNVKKIHEYLFKKCFDFPIGSPDTEIMKMPKWSTFARFRENVSQSDVLTVVNNIRKNGFTSSQIDIGQGYERNIGDFNFNNEKFRNAHQMIGELKESKLKVSTSVNPFISNDSYTYSEAGTKKYFMMETVPNSNIKNDIGQFNFIFHNKSVSLIDVTNTEAIKWLNTHLGSIQADHLIDSFKFELGEASFLSSKMKSQGILHNPCEYTTKYVELAQTFGNRVIVKAGFQTQKFSVYVEIGDRTSTWKKEDGLPSLIPTVLTYGILGYPFVIPGPIGGFSQTINKTSGIPSLPDRELYIRWLQIAAYLPVMEFSVAPWQYDEEVVNIAKKYIGIHQTKVLPILLLSAKESQINGAPLIRPLWWIAPEDETALRIDCEFLVGNYLLVAPILEMDVSERDVYLPEGSNWEDQLHDIHYEGGQWLTGYKVTLNEIPTFVRLKLPL